MRFCRVSVIIYTFKLLKPFNFYYSTKQKPTKQYYTRKVSAKLSILRMNLLGKTYEKKILRNVLPTINIWHPLALFYIIASHYPMADLEHSVDEEITGEQNICILLVISYSFLSWIMQLLSRLTLMVDMRMLVGIRVRKCNLPFLIKWDGDN